MKFLLRKGTPVEFVDGAAYVSQGDGHLYVRLPAEPDEYGQPDPYRWVCGDRRSLTDESVPDDLVCIWKPGDRIDGKPSLWTVIYHGRPGGGATETPVELEADPEDATSIVGVPAHEMRVDTYTSSGNPAVRVTHLPTGHVEDNQDTPDATENKNRALRQMQHQMRGRLARLAADELCRETQQMEQGELGPVKWPRIMMAGSNCQEATRPFTAHMCDGPEARPLATPEEALEIRKRKNAPHLGNWFYPTRMNETPGRYEDEFGNGWEFVEVETKGNPAWHSLDSGDGWFDVPMWTADPYNPEYAPIAVRWVGELDE